MAQPIDFWRNPDFCPKASRSDRVAGIRAAFIALQTLDGIECRRYSIAVLSTSPPGVLTEAIEQLRKAGELDEGRYEQFTQYERRGYAFHHGREEGREEGRAEGVELGLAQGLRRALLDLITLRGFAMSTAEHHQISECKELATLERWYAQVKSLDPSTQLSALLR